jgi:two-component system OmpR family response regulator
MAGEIFLAEDDGKIANVVRVYLEEAGFSVRHFAMGEDLLAAAAERRPLAAILDLMLPGMSGEEVCQALKETGDLPVIMLTSKASEEERIAGFALGADDYVVKPFSPRELVWRLKAVLKRNGGRQGATAGLLSFGGGRLLLDEQEYRATLDGSDLVLTPTEFKLLHTLASTPQKVFSREELVERALGYSFEGYERSVDAHVKNLRQKLTDDPRQPRFIQTVYGVGYRFLGRRDG